MIIYICINHSFAQEVKLGFRAEIFAPVYEKTDAGKSFQLFMPPNIYGVLAFKPIENFQLDLRPGISFVEDYGGFELGSYLKFFPSESIYLLAAYNLHFMGGEAHGFHSNNETTFTMPGAGIGILTGKHSSIEFLLFIPTPKDWMYDVQFENVGFKSIITKFDLIFKIGFGFDWSL